MRLLVLIFNIIITFIIYYKRKNLSGKNRIAKEVTETRAYRIDHYYF